MLVQIKAPHFCAGVVGETHVERAAPILRYMLGWPWERVWLYVVAKGWSTHAAP
jgi:hypothetical protein